MPEPEYQWPSGTRAAPATYETAPSGERDRIAGAVEQYFTDRFGAAAVFVPSGRAALSLALRLAGAGRAHTIFAPKWSSHCIWNIVGRYGNPTTSTAGDVDIAIAVYKFGRLATFANRPPIVIDDSCDSWLAGNATLFPSGGTCEIFSLPKIMGTYGGGLLVCADPQVAQRAREIAAASVDCSAAQGLARWRFAAHVDASEEAWDASAYRDFVPDYCLAKHVFENLDAFDVNGRTIAKRLRAIRDRGASMFAGLDAIGRDGRLPPVLVSSAPAPDASFMQRFIDVDRSFDRPRFVKSALLPLHFGVGDAQFQALLDALMIAGST